MRLTGKPLSIFLKLFLVFVVWVVFSLFSYLYINNLINIGGISLKPLYAEGSQVDTNLDLNNNFKLSIRRASEVNWLDHSYDQEIALINKVTREETIITPYNDYQEGHYTVFNFNNQDYLVIRVKEYSGNSYVYDKYIVTRLGNKAENVAEFLSCYMLRPSPQGLEYYALKNPEGEFAAKTTCHWIFDSLVAEPGTLTKISL